MVDAIVKVWIRQLEEERVDMGDIRTLVTCFYTDNKLVACRYDDTLQKAFHVLTGFFDCVGLLTNTTKAKVINFTTGRVRTPFPRMFMRLVSWTFYTGWKGIGGRRNAPRVTIFLPWGCCRAK